MSRTWRLDAVVSLVPRTHIGWDAVAYWPSYVAYSASYTVCSQVTFDFGVNVEIPSSYVSLVPSHLQRFLPTVSYKAHKIAVRDHACKTQYRPRCTNQSMPDHYEGTEVRTKYSASETANIVQQSVKSDEGSGRSQCPEVGAR